MDKFVTVSRQKESEEITGRDSQLEYIKSLLEKNTSFCIWGSIGIGKTFLIKHALIGVQYIDLSSDFFKIERIRDTYTHVLADGVLVSEPLSLGSTIVISDGPIENFECIKLEPLSIEDMILVGIKKKFSGIDIRTHAIISHGDMRVFLFRLDKFVDKRDVFKSPKDFVYDLLCRDGSLDPHDYIGKTVMEHGYSWGIVHENYLDSSISGDNITSISDMMSLADIKDEDIYSGQGHNNIFSLFGILLPSISINHTLERDSMRPGSAWTKFNNYKMRHRRYQALSGRKGFHVDIDSLMVISQYCKGKTDVIPMLEYYGFESADIDMMNHISLINKIKPRVLQNIKTRLKLLVKE